MESSRLSVRLWAASHVLEFAPKLAEAELERLAMGPRGPLRLNAEMTLQEWRAGHLQFREEEPQDSSQRNPRKKRPKPG